MSALPPASPVAVVGGGVMGSGIAMVAASAGHTVLLYDLQPEAAQRAVDSIRSQYAKLAARGKLNEQQAEAAAIHRFHSCVREALQYTFSHCGSIYPLLVFFFILLL